MGLSHAEMDRIVEDHFGFEAADDLDGVIGSLAAEVEHELVPSPIGPTRDKDEIRAFYAMLFESVHGESVKPLKRYYGDGFLIDETLWTGEIADGRPFLCDGRSGRVSFRLLHVFEFDGGRISREQTWCDLAAIQKQLGVRLV